MAGFLWWWDCAGRLNGQIGQHSGQMRSASVSTFARRSSWTKRAALDHQQAVGDVEREAQHLLGDDDGELAQLADLAAGPAAMSLMIDGWMPSVGSSSSSTLGRSPARARWRAAAAGRRRGCRPCARSCRTAPGTARRSPPACARLCVPRRPVRMFSSTVSVRKDHAALRHVGEALRHALVASRSPATSLPSTLDAAAPAPAGCPSAP